MSQGTEHALFIIKNKSGITRLFVYSISILVNQFYLNRSFCKIVIQKFFLLRNIPKCKTKQNKFYSE